MNKNLFVFWFAQPKTKIKQIKRVLNSEYIYTPTTHKIHFFILIQGKKWFSIHCSGKVHWDRANSFIITIIRWLLCASSMFFGYAILLWILQSSDT